uniref:Uncharacterized protein n=1 Tax=Rhizophora mucronata TaxID=61149 RepID=A0A2P2NLY8_RHIMU
MVLNKLEFSHCFTSSISKEVNMFYFFLVMDASCSSYSDLISHVEG